MINYNHPIVQEDLKQFTTSNLDWTRLKNKSVLITGATGMLASYFAFVLRYLNEKQHYNIKLILLARHQEKIKKVFGENLKNTAVLLQDVAEEINYKDDIDYILHAAGSASPYYIINDPVGIINANTKGTKQVLELARQKDIQNLIFTSTREIYGKVENRPTITETDMGSLDPLNPRSCYPESKRLAETLLTAYCSQYNIPFNALRIAHSYGPGMSIKNDGRVMSDFMNDAVEQRDIQLNSTGQAERAFCYITDVVEAMFRVMLEGKNGEAYNIANETEPIKIVDLAKQLQKISKTGKTVSLPESKSKLPKKGYTNYKRVALDTAKLEDLGWTPQVDLKEGLRRTLNSFHD